MVIRSMLYSTGPMNGSVDDCNGNDSDDCIYLDCIYTLNESAVLDSQNKK